MASSGAIGLAFIVEVGNKMAFGEILRSGTVPLAEKVSFVRCLIEGDALRSEWNGREIAGMTWEEFEGQFKGLEERARAQLLHDVSIAIGRQSAPSPASTGVGGVAISAAAGAGGAAAAAGPGPGPGVAGKELADEGKVEESHPHTETLLKMLASQGLCISVQDSPEDQALTRSYVNQMLKAATQAGLLDLRAFDTKRAYSLAEFTQILGAHPGWSKVFTDPAVIAKLFFIVTDGAKKSPFTLATLALTASWLGDHRPDLTPPLVPGQPETHTTCARIIEMIHLGEYIAARIQSINDKAKAQCPTFSFVSFPSAFSKDQGITISLIDLRGRDEHSRLIRRNVLSTDPRCSERGKVPSHLFVFDVFYQRIRGGYQPTYLGGSRKQFFQVRTEGIMTWVRTVGIITLKR